MSRAQDGAAAALAPALTVDAHVHLWDEARGDDILVLRRVPALRRIATPDDLEAVLDARSIARAVVVQAAPAVAETRYLLEMAHARDRIAGVVGWVDLRAAEVATALDELRASPKLRGVRAMLHRIPEPEWIEDASTADGLAALARSGLSLDVTATPRHLDPCRRALRRLPQLRAVVDHGGTPAIAGGEWDDWAPRIAALARETTAFCKLSGLIEEAAPGWTIDDLLPYARHLLACFGPARLVAGSNWPVVDLAGGHGRWWDTMLTLLGRMGMSPDERASILGGAAVALYRLEVPRVP